jgi:asparagine synthase (glutamine-hydrolysing)
MWFSVETRLPFLDYELVEKCVSLDDTLKVQRGFLKYILRSAMDDMLPRDITWRTNKFGFESPQKKWFAQHHEKMMNEIGNCGLTADYLPYLDLKDSDSLWRMYNAALWSKISWK